MTEKIRKTIADSKTARWSVLALVAFLMLCGYFITDVMAPLKPMLEEQFAWTSSQYGFFTGAYGFFNVFLLMLIIGGIILDKFGSRFTGLMATVIMIIGVSMKYWAISTPSLTASSMSLFGFGNISHQVLFAALGYAIFGVGVEIAGITVSKILVRWFTGKELALAMGLEMACARIGTGLAIGITPLLAEWFAKDGVPSISTPILMSIVLLIVGLISFLVFVVMDKRLDKELIEENAEPEEPFKLADILSIIRIKAFWYIGILCVLFYSAVFPFLKYAPDLMGMKFGVVPKLAGTIPALLPFGTIILTPLFGNMYDRKGKGASIMFFGALMLIIIHLLFSLPFINNWVFAVILTLLLGIAFSLVPSAMWPSVPKIIPQNKLGTAYALIFWIQNWGLMLVPMLIGWVLDTYCKTVDPVTGAINYNYTLPMQIFTCLGVLALLFAWLLKREDKRKGYGLEEPNIKK